MRRLPIFALLSALALPAAAQAPSTPPGAPPQARRGHGDLQALGLSDEQKRKLREIRQQYPDDPKARRKAALEVLTPEQRDKLKEIRRHHRAQQRAPQGD